MKTAKDILLENIPKDCWWEEMENLTNTPVEYVTKAMESFAAQSVREYKEELAKKNSLDQFLEVYQKLVFTECEKAVYDYKEKLKEEINRVIDLTQDTQMIKAYDNVCELIESTH